MDNRALPTNGGLYVRPSHRPEGEGAARYPDGNPRINTTLQQSTTLRLPGELVAPSTDNSLVDPTNYVSQLRKSMQQVRAPPTRPAHNAFKLVVMRNRCLYVFCNISTQLPCILDLSILLPGFTKSLWHLVIHLVPCSGLLSNLLKSLWHFYRHLVPCSGQQLDVHSILPSLPLPAHFLYSFSSAMEDYPINVCFPEVSQQMERWY